MGCAELGGMRDAGCGMKARWQVVWWVVGLRTENSIIKGQNRARLRVEHI